ncbi:MAG: hypothetical protein IH955_09420 [Chloroflexi bacterium]|nr:hypothetical protein [Chloroflexota bacterium]
MQKVVGLEPGDRYEAGELTITTCRSRHPEPGLIYRLADRHTGASVGLAWDTAPDAGVADHVEGVDLLVHDGEQGLQYDLDWHRPRQVDGETALKVSFLWPAAPSEWAWRQSRRG